MFNNYRPHSPFYVNNIFELFSSDSEDSDFESDWSEIMAASAILNRSTASSQVHKTLKSHLDANPIEHKYFNDNRKIFRKIYDVDAELWKNFDDAKNAYVIDADLSVRIEQATAIANAAVKIREANVATASTVIRASNATVLLDGLDVAELDALETLRRVVVAKMTGKPAPVVSQVNNADQMVLNMNEDIKAIKITGFIPEKYLVNHYIWRCYQHAARKGIRVEEFEQTSAHSCNEAVWKCIVERWTFYDIDHVHKNNNAKHTKSKIE